MTAAARRRPKILIVDDSEIVCASVATMLDSHGYDVVTLPGIFSFIQTLAVEKPDLALIDVSMPALNGDKLVEIANKHREASCLLVLFSNRKPDELAKLAKRCGAVGFIQKTGNAEVLAREVGTFLRGRGR